MTLAITLSLIVAALAIGLVVVSLRHVLRDQPRPPAPDEFEDFDGSF